MSSSSHGDEARRALAEVTAIIIRAAPFVETEGGTFVRGLLNATPSELAAQIIAALRAEPVRAGEERIVRLEEALRLTLRFTDYAAGEGIAFIPSPDEAEMDAADICCTVARTLNIELGGPEYMAIVARALPIQPAAEGGAE